MTRAPAVEAVVMGGSAGAVQALLAFAGALPPDWRLPVAIVVHLPARRPNALPELLAARCARPVREARDKEPLEPGTLLVAPPDYHLLVDAGPVLALSGDEPVRFSRPSIDVLFESAARELGPRLAAVLLSGANEDGADGLAAVGRAGGVTLVQAPAQAPSPTMPAAGLARWPAARALPVEELVELLRALQAPEGA